MGVMSIGAMRSVVLIQKKLSVSDDQGGHVTKWQDFEECPARITTLSLREQERFSQFQIDATRSIIIRFLEGLDENMRMFDMTTTAEGTLYDIVSVEDFKERSRFMRVLVREHAVKQAKRRNR